MSAEREYHGLGVAPGVAIGVAYVRETGGLEVPERKLRKVEVPDEELRLEKAVELARRQIRRLQNRTGDLPGTASEELGFLLDAYQQMLCDSRLVRGAKARIVDDAAGREALRARFLYAQSFSQDDPWAQRAEGAEREHHAPMARFTPQEEMA